MQANAGNSSVQGHQSVPRIYWLTQQDEQRQLRRSETINDQIIQLDIQKDPAEPIKKKKKKSFFYIFQF